MFPHNICVPGKIPLSQKDVIALMNELRDMSFETASVFIEMNNKILEAMFLFSPSLIGEINLGNKLPVMKIPAVFLPFAQIFQKELLKNLP